MIGYLEGIVLKNDGEGVLLLVNGIGYEIFLPEITSKSFKENEIGEKAGLFIYYHQTERQPVPVLIGFENEKDKVFFKKFISVEDIGVIKAVKALTIPVEKIVNAIETEDIKTLVSLKGIGKRTAGKIVATLKGKFSDFEVSGDSLQSDLLEDSYKKDFVGSVIDVMVTQLGHNVKEARQLISDVFKRNPDIKSPEDLLTEVYKKN
ncbi:MAG: Holliday junction DNA helicase RuvA [Deltaproteobacteria bacterium]|nr:MAG: Holliday junction DNA helicase RuvA [Deltaproteobacteria bacterium]